MARPWPKAAKPSTASLRPEFRSAGGVVVCGDAPRLRRLRVSRRAQRGSRDAKRLPLMRASTAAWNPIANLDWPRLPSTTHMQVASGGARNSSRALSHPTSTLHPSRGTVRHRAMTSRGASSIRVNPHQSRSFHLTLDRPASALEFTTHTCSNFRKLIFTRKRRSILTFAHIAEFCIMPVDNVMRQTDVERCALAK